VDYLPLVLLVLVLVGAAVVFPFMRRLKRAAQTTLEASKALDASLRALQTQQAQQGDTSPPGPPQRSAEDERRGPGGPRA
jgi:type II secretory pathway pseudopilin PulG